MSQAIRRMENNGDPSTQQGSKKTTTTNPMIRQRTKVWLNAKNLTLPYGMIKLAPKRHGPFKIVEVRLPVVY
jgi:hypothetical protein